MKHRPVILCYHAVSETWESELAVTPDLLATHLSYFKKRGYTSLTFAECEQMRAVGKLPDRTVVITFDDGYESMLLAKTVLDRFGYVASVFAVTEFVGTERPMCWDGVEQWLGTDDEHEMKSLNWDQLGELIEAGWEVGSHTKTHPDLTALGDAEMTKELESSKELLERRIGPCKTIAYPYGHVNDRVAEATFEAGYEAACTLPRTQRTDTRFLRPRIGLYPRDRGLRFRLKTSKALRHLL